MDQVKSRMENYSWISLILTMSYIAAMAMAGDCEKDRAPAFTHMLTLHYDGSGANNGTRESFMASYGDCRNVDRNAEKMFQFLESFGIDVTIPRSNAFKAYFLEDYDLQPFVDEHKAILASFYELAENVNAPAYCTFWRLVTKRNYNTTQGMIQKGSLLYFGLYRVKLAGREVCIDYQPASPGVPVNDGFYQFQTFHMDLYSEQWGTGLAQGVLHNRPGRKTLHWVFLFPPEGQL